MSNDTKKCLVKFSLISSNNNKITVEINSVIKDSMYNVYICENMAYLYECESAKNRTAKMSTLKVFLGNRLFTTHLINKCSWH